MLCEEPNTLLIDLLYRSPYDETKQMYLDGSRDEATGEFVRSPKEFPYNRSDAELGIIAHPIITGSNIASVEFVGKQSPDAILNRFVNEADSYHDVVSAMFSGPQQGERQRCHLICDHRFIIKYGLGALRPHAIGLDRMIRNGYLIRGSTITELAKRIGIDAATLERTISRHNTFAAAGRAIRR